MACITMPYRLHTAGKHLLEGRPNPLRRPLLRCRSGATSLLGGRSRCMEAAVAHSRCAHLRAARWRLGKLGRRGLRRYGRTMGVRPRRTRQTRFRFISATPHCLLAVQISLHIFGCWPSSMIGQRTFPCLPSLICFSLGPLIYGLDHGNFSWSADFTMDSALNPLPPSSQVLQRIDLAKRDKSRPTPACFMCHAQFNSWRQRDCTDQPSNNLTLCALKHDDDTKKILCFCLIAFTC